MSCTASVVTFFCNKSVHDYSRRHCRKSKKYIDLAHAAQKRGHRSVPDSCTLTEIEIVDHIGRRVYVRASSTPESAILILRAVIAARPPIGASMVFDVVLELYVVCTFARCAILLT